MKCPSCGREASGRFCEDCGASLAAVTCRGCGVELSGNGKFCHKCGMAHAPVSVAAAGSAAALSWVALGVSGISLVLALVALFGGARPPQQTNGSTPFPAAGAPLASAPAPDISNMSPREQADRLFNRIMAAHERGDNVEKDFFRDMALQAYALLGPLDTDARYHVGLIHAVTGRPEAALAQVDSMRAEVPNHLLAIMLEHTVHGGTDANAPRLTELSQSFVQSYDAEIASGRQEYLDHRQSLETFRSQAGVAR